MTFERFRRTEKVESTVQKQQGDTTKETAITRHDQKKSFAHGEYSSVHETKVYISNDPKERKLSLVVKKYTEGPHFDSNDDEVEANAQNAYEKYQMAKAAGLKVPTTYRLDAANNSIVMTNYNNEGGVAFGLNPNTKTEGLISNTRIRDITNFETLLEELRAQCALAADNQIKLSTDAFFLLFPRKGGRMRTL